MGVYYYDNTRTTWLNYSQGLPIVCSINDMDVFNTGTSQGYVRVYYYGRGVWESPVKQTAGNPFVNITSPANLSTFITNSNITITANANDIGGTISKVEFLNGAQVIGTATTSPYSITWNNVVNGTYTITAKATDNDLKTTTSESITISVTSNLCNAVGNIGREQWDNVTGNNIITSLFNTTPSSTSTLTIFEGPTEIGDNYQSRIRGYVCPPLTGTYTFWISGDDNSELWLSTNVLPANKTLLCKVSGSTNIRGWDDYPEQKSTTITLQAGTKYYIEAIQKEGAGGDHLAVGWQLPGGTFERPILGSRLSPYVPTADPNATGTYYQDCNFGGYAIDLLKADYTTAQLVANGISNNDISSIKVKNKFEIMIFDLDNFKGDSLLINSDNACLVNQGFNDKISSLKIRKDSRLVGSFYQHCNYDNTGYSVDLYEGNYTTSQLVDNGIVNNDISSFTVKNGYEIILFDGDNFTGDSVIIKANDNCLVAQSFNDKTSSLKIRKVKVVTNIDLLGNHHDAMIKLYPNPVDNISTVSYELIKPTMVEIIIINKEGKIINTLIKEFQTEGTHQFEFNASDLSTGVYILKIITSYNNEVFTFAKVSKPKK